MHYGRDSRRIFSLWLIRGGFDMTTLSDAIQYAKQAIKEGVLLDYYFTDNGNIIGISDQGEFIWWRDKE